MWRTNFEERLQPGSDGGMLYWRADGSIWEFEVVSSGVLRLKSPADNKINLVSGSVVWTMTLKNGERRLFDMNSGILKAIIDRNDNAITLSHDTSNRLFRVSEPSGHYLDFQYGDDVVTKVVSDTGRTVSYEYYFGYLSGVIYPDNYKISYYWDNSRGFISEVSDSAGRILSKHTYDDAGRGTSSSRGDQVEQITVAYPD